MTNKQITAAENTLPTSLSDEKWTESQRQLYKELRCRRMINSIMVYGNINSPYNAETDTFNPYLQHYVDGNTGYFFLGRERVLELIHEQQADFAKAEVISGAGTDCEGCIYHSIRWEDD